MYFKIENFGQKLKEAREKNKISRAQMAKKLNMTPQAYGAYELGKREPPVSKLINICEFLHVSPHDLLGYESDTNDELEKAIKTFEKYGYIVHKPVKDFQGQEIKGVFQVTDKDDDIPPISVKNYHDLINILKSAFHNNRFQQRQEMLWHDAIKNSLYRYKGYRHYPVDVIIKGAMRNMLESKQISVNQKSKLLQLAASLSTDEDEKLLIELLKTLKNNSDTSK